MTANNDFCLFGRRMHYSEPTEFDIKYIQSQHYISYEELGDQVDESFDLMKRIAGQTGDNPEDQRYRAEEIQYCIQQRYLGSCSMKGCLFSERVEEVLCRN